LRAPAADLDPDAGGTANRHADPTADRDGFVYAIDYTHLHAEFYANIDLYPNRDGDRDRQPNRNPGL